MYVCMYVGAARLSQCWGRGVEITVNNQNNDDK